MKKILPIILIVLGIAEIIIAVADIKMPIIIAFILGAIFIACGIKILLDMRKNK